jgi:TolA-binding protein
LTETVEMEIKLGELLREKKLYALAAENFENVAANENAAAALRYRAALTRGWCFIDAEEYDKATKAFSRAIKLALTDEDRGRATFLAAESAARQGNHSNAALLYQTVAEDFTGTQFAEAARFKQAQMRTAEGSFSKAAMIYRQFLDEFPDSKLRRQALLERGMALKNSGDFATAMTELLAFVEGFPAAAQAPQALMEGFAAARAAGQQDKAIGFLSRLITDYESSPLLPHAYYQRIHLSFLLGKTEAALADTETFLGRFARLPLAADVLIWRGDHYLNTGSTERAEASYLQVVSEHPGLPQAHSALYEAARSAHERGKRDRAVLLLEQLSQNYQDQADSQLLARAEMLWGDIISEAGEFEEAVSHFRKAGKLAEGSLLEHAATGRVADMYYSIDTRSTEPGSDQATAEERPLARARTIFQSLADNSELPPHVRESARYRLAKTLEKLEQVDLAIENYLDIVYQYDIDLKAGNVRDWYYFSRSGYDAARLLVLQERFEEAARVYERLHKSGIPTAEDALAKAREIRTQKH